MRKRGSRRTRRVILGLVLCAAVGACRSPAPTAEGPAPASATSPARQSPAPPTAPPPTAAPSSPPVTEPASPPAPPSTPTPAPTPPEAPLAGIELVSLDAAGGLDLALQAGAYWLRRNALFWSVVEPVEGERAWGNVTGLEGELQNAAARGAEVILIVRDAPIWAQSVPGHPCSPIKAEKLEAFADFMAEAVSRYSAPPYQVRYWELGNEPDVFWRDVPSSTPYGCWGDPDDPFFGGGYYAEMLKAVYPRVKAADPEARVLVGGLLLDCDPLTPPEIPPGSGQVRDCTSSRFLQGVLENGGGAYFDGVSFHAYDYYGAPDRYANLNWHSASTASGPVLIAKTRYLRGLLADYGHPDKFLLNTEVALLCGGSGQESACRSEDFAETKAAYLAQAYAAALAEGLRANLWFSLRGWRGSELVDRSLQPLPAYRAFLFNARQLNSAAMRGEVTGYPGVKGYQFERDGVRVWILWSSDGLSHTVRLPTQPGAVYDLYGAPLAAEQDLPVTAAPLYVEWAP